MSYTVHQAKTNLSRLIKEAESGKEVIITRGKEPVAKIDADRQRRREACSRLFKGQISWSGIRSLTDEEMRELGLNDFTARSIDCGTE